MLFIALKKRKFNVNNNNNANFPATFIGLSMMHLVAGRCIFFLCLKFYTMDKQQTLYFNSHISSSIVNRFTVRNIDEPRRVNRDFSSAIKIY